MELQRFKRLSEIQKQQVYELWNREYPEKLAHKALSSFDNYLDKLQQGFHLLAIHGEQLAGWLFVFEREEDTWFAMIVDSSHQGRGLRSKLLQKAKESSPKLLGWVIDHDHDKKIDGQTYLSPLAFYLKNDFVVNSELRLERDNISAVNIYWNRTDE